MAGTVNNLSIFVSMQTFWLVDGSDVLRIADLVQRDVRRCRRRAESAVMVCGSSAESRKQGEMSQ